MPSRAANPCGKEGAMKYILYIAIFAAIYVVIRQIIRKVTGK